MPRGFFLPMKIYTPSYYARFRCLAGDCRDTCCRGWEIDIDPDSYARYLAQPGKIGDRLRAAIDAQETPHFRLVGAEERCPFLNAQNLCDLYAELGRESLCQICARHPRYNEQYGDFAEMGVGLACEAATRLVLLTRAPMRLSCADGPAPFADADAPDPAVCHALFALRARLFRLLQDRSIPLFSRLAQALALCQTVQTRLERAASIEEFIDILTKAAKPTCTGLPGEMPAVSAAEAGVGPVEAPKSAACTADIFRTVQALIAAFSPAESMEPEWRTLLDRVAVHLGSDTEKVAHSPSFPAESSASPTSQSDSSAPSPAFSLSAPELPGADGLLPEVFFEQFAVYLVFRYFGKASFDGEVLLPMQLCAASCALLRLLLTDELHRTGALSPDRACRIAQLFSKEVEYCPDNLDAILDALENEDALSPTNLRQLSRFFARTGENSPIDERRGLC